MSALDWIVLLGTTLGICVYGWWHTRGRQALRGYIKGDERTSWVTIGLGVMATQASAITFLSTPGQGYADGLKFIQIYFGLPIAMVIIAAVFVPIFRKLNVYTAYEYLGQRFDQKTRLLGRGTVPDPARPGRRLHHLRAVHHHLQRHGLAAESHHHSERRARDHLHRVRRLRSGERHAKISNAADFWRPDCGVFCHRGENAARRFPRRRSSGGRQRRADAGD